MTEALAQHLAARLKAALPFLDRVVGMVRLNEQVKPDGETSFMERLPVPVSFTADECDRNRRYLVPDQSVGSVLFFEDGGETVIGSSFTQQREATLRLLLWLNPFKLTGLLPESRLQAELERALSVRKRFSVGEYADVFITATSLPAGANLFSGYSFGSGTTQLLYPPYRVMGLELKARYRFTPACVLGPLPELDLDRAGCALPPELLPEIPVVQGGFDYAFYNGGYAFTS